MVFLTILLVNTFNQSFDYKLELEKKINEIEEVVNKVEENENKREVVNKVEENENKREEEVNEKSN